MPKLSDIAQSPGPPANSDTVVGVSSGGIDTRFSITELGITLASGVSSVSNVDGSLSISPVTGGVIASAPKATNTTFGIVKPDNTTITVSGGVISSTGGGGGGGVTSVTNSDGTITVLPTTGSVVVSGRIATMSQTGMVRPDNSTITISGGVISSTTGGGGGGGPLPQFATVLSLAAGHPGNVPYVQVFGFYAAGDCDEASTMFRQVAQSSYNTVTDADGRFWAYVPNLPGINPLWFGVKRGTAPTFSTAAGAPADNAAAWFGGFLSSLKIYARGANQGYPIDNAANDYGNFNGWISGTTLNISGSVGAALLPGQGIRANTAGAANAVLPGTVVTGGNSPTYTINLSQTVASSGSPIVFTRDAPTFQVQFALATDGATANVIQATWYSWNGTAYVPSPHGLIPNDGVVFHALSGTLPSQLKEDQTYYVLGPPGDALFGPNTFAVSAINNFTLGSNVYPSFVNGPGPPIVGTTIPGGIFTAFPCREKVRLNIPPGYYDSGYQNIGLLTGGDCRETNVNAQGVVWNNSGTGNIGAHLGISNTGFDSWALINTAYAGAVSVSCINIGDASKFYVGQWGVVACGERQSGFQQQGSWPPNFVFFEFVQITSISGAAIHFDPYRLTQNYYATWPTFNPGPPSTSGSANYAPTGPACFYGLPPVWDAAFEVDGGMFINQYQQDAQAREIHLKNQTYIGRGVPPSVTRRFFLGHVDEPNISVEQDKVVYDVTYSGCHMFGIDSESISATRFLTVEAGSIIGQLKGGGRITEVNSSTIEHWDFGGLYGQMEEIKISGSIIKDFPSFASFNDPGGATSFAQLPNNYTWVTLLKGVLKYPLPLMGTGSIQVWAAPGAKLFVGSFDPSSQARNLGSPFVIMDVYGENISHLPVTTSSLAPQKLNGIGSSTTLVTAYAPMLIVPASAGGSVDSALPVGDGGVAIVYVSATNLHTGDCQVSATPGGTDITFNNDAFGTINAWVGSFCMTTTLSDLPGINGSTLQGMSVTTAVAPAAGTTLGIGTSTAYVKFGTPVVFIIPPGTAGKLDAAVNSATTYYVQTGPTGTTCTVGTSPTGGTITFAGGSSGMAAITNPLFFQNHRAPSMTVFDSTGCPLIKDMNGSVKRPLFSKFDRAYSGRYDTPLFSSPPTLWGQLDSTLGMTIDVKRADTVGGANATLAINCLGFNNLLPAGFTQLIDLTLAGVRNIPRTGTPVTIGGNDVLKAYPYWLGGVVGINPAGPPNTVTFSGTTVTGIGSALVSPGSQLVFVSTGTLDTAINDGRIYTVKTAPSSSTCTITAVGGTAGDAVAFNADGTGTQKGVVLNGGNNSGQFYQKPIFEVRAYSDQGVTSLDVWSFIGSQFIGNTVTSMDSSLLGGA